MTKSHIFTEAHRRTREQVYKPAGYRNTFANYLRVVISENKKSSKLEGYVKMDSSVVVLRETEKAILIGCKENGFEMWVPKSQSIVDGSVFVKDWLIRKNRDARYFAAQGALI